MATTHARVPDSVYERATDVKDKYGYPTIGEAIRHMCQEGNYDV
jgi:antitoxin component of RelBE/YafQ-DinJ toxin-antitoxin module